MTLLYRRPKSPPSMTPSMNRDTSETERWHSERSTLGFIEKAVHTGWLEPVEPPDDDGPWELMWVYRGTPGDYDPDRFDVCAIAVREVAE